MPRFVLIALFTAGGGLGEVSAAPPTVGVPVLLGRLAAAEPAETSGIAMSRRNPGILWAHNDGHDGRLFAIRTNGQVAAVFQLPWRPNDLEDIAIATVGATNSPVIYLGDIGDNDNARRRILVYRFPEPVLSASTAPTGSVLAGVEAFNLLYPDGPQDAEALLVDPRSGDILIVTKHPKRSRLYYVRAADLVPGRTVTLVAAGTANRDNISAGDVSPDGRLVLLRREKQAWLWERAGVEPLWETLVRLPVKAAVVGPPAEPNGESIAFDPDGEGYYTLSEGVRQPIYFFPLLRDR